MRRLLRATQGSLSVEFALVSFLFVTILAMCLEVSRVQIATMLLERSVYDIAHQTRVARGENFSTIAQSVIEARGNGLFKAEEVRVEAFSGPRLEDVLNGAGTAGAGYPNDVVRLVLTAKLGIFSSFVPQPLQITRTIEYFFRNEPSVEAGI